MAETIEDLIRNNYTLLTKRLQVEKLIPHFIERRFLDFPDKQIVMSKTTTPGKAEALLELLAQKGSCKTEEFVEILKKADHRHVADELKTTSTRNETTKVVADVQEEHFDDVIIKEASARWDDLARKLGFNKNTIDVIRDFKPDQDSRCREMLERWRNGEGRKATLRVLKQALIDIGETRTAENLGGL
ncbi:uncharacterized protein [Branchiostoma lanceolatum]|uniref:uncharacterized protein n=1 Tax=Branchiostoma lanceolatum TaxID=7740 RepID=UPI003452CD0F